MIPKLIFIHIYKCAGTTIRNLLQNNYTILIDNHNSDVIYNYKKEYENTPIYNGEDIIFGHFLYNKYSFGGFPPFVTFLRHPIDRMISQYFYDLDCFGDNALDYMKNGIIEYSKFNNNLMSRFIGNFNNISFFGVTERLEQSILRMKEVFNLKIPDTITNFNVRNSESRIELTKKEVRELEKINSRDMELYFKVLQGWE